MCGGWNIARKLRKVTCTTGFLGELFVLELGLNSKEIYWAMVFVEIPHRIIDMLVALIVEILGLNTFSNIW